MVLFMTPWVRPLSWQQLLFTYLIPIIPLCYAWDGQASIMRIYTFDDIQNFFINIYRLHCFCPKLTDFLELLGLVWQLSLYIWG